MEPAGLASQEAEGHLHSPFHMSSFVSMALRPEWSVFPAADRSAAVMPAGGLKAVRRRAATGETTKLRHALPTAEQLVPEPRLPP